MSTLRKLGSYELTHHIGRGGMGDVWRARHERLLRHAAVKLIHPDAMGPGAGHTLSRRFEREAKATAALTSPHTIRLYDFGRTDDGTFYYVMELLEGIDLKSAVDRYGPMEPARVAYLLRQACESLAEAHHAGLVHRDVKPPNLFVCKAGLRHDFVKVLDFGLVKILGKGDVESAQLTRGDVAPGSPAYISPEAVEGPERVDARSDIYGLGCVAYWLLTGGLVFELESSLGLLLAHVRDAPVPPSERTSTRIPPELDELVLRCLAKRPDERPQSCVELEALLAALPFDEPWTQERAKAWWAEHEPARQWGGQSELMWPDEPGGKGAIGSSELEAAREEVQAALRHNYVYSRMDFSEMDRRVEAARRASKLEDLQALVADLPEGADALSRHFAPATEPPLALPEARAETELGRQDTVGPAGPVAGKPAGAPPAVVETAEEVPRAAREDRTPVDPLALPSQDHLPPLRGHMGPGREGAMDVVRSRYAQPAPLEARLTRNVVSIFGGSRRSGRWWPARKMYVVGVFGGSELDFREAELPPGMTEVVCINVLGGTEITVPQGLYVKVDGVGVAGAFEREGPSAPYPDGNEPWLRVTGTAVLGGVKVLTAAADGDDEPRYGAPPPRLPPPGGASPRRRQ